MVKQIWYYTINHKWSKDILRANFLFILLVLLYNLVHLHTKTINFHIFISELVLMNICLGLNTLLNRFVN